MSPIVSNIIIIAILAVAVFFASRSAVKHFKGEGSCCGGGSGVKLIKPKKLDNVLAVKTIRIEGMMCEHCEKRVRDALEAFPEIENAEPNYISGRVRLTLSGEADLKKIRKAISAAGYKMK